METVSSARSIDGVGEELVQVTGRSRPDGRVGFRAQYWSSKDVGTVASTFIGGSGGVGVAITLGDAEQPMLGACESRSDRDESRRCLLLDLNEVCRLSSRAPFDILVFELPDDALSRTGKKDGGKPSSTPAPPFGLPFQDGVIVSFAQALLACFSGIQEVPEPFVDYQFEALSRYLALTYGPFRARPPRTVMADWQERLAKSRLTADLTEAVTLDRVAAECGLSVSYFVRIFRLTTGTTPHQWLMARRLEEARILLADDRIGLAEIASACGFADQSHFTRMFARAEGESPGKWRRMRADLRPSERPGPMAPRLPDVPPGVLELRSVGHAPAAQARPA